MRTNERGRIGRLLEDVATWAIGGALTLAILAVAYLHTALEWLLRRLRHLWWGYGS